MTQDIRDVLKLALEALEANYLLVNGTETHGGLEQCLDGYYSGCFDTDPINKKTDKAITAIKEALAQPVQCKYPDCNYPCIDLPDCMEQEPVADDFFRTIADKNPKPFPSPQSTWVGLTEEEIMQIWGGIIKYATSEVRIKNFARYIENKLKELNDHRI